MKTPEHIKLQPLDIQHIEQCTHHLATSTRKLVLEEYFKLYASDRKAANLFLTRLDAKASRKRNFAKPSEKYAYECQEAIRIFGIDGGIRLFKNMGLSIPKGETKESTIARMVDSEVWARKLKAKNYQSNEKSFIHAGHICRGKQVYVSDWWVNRFIELQKDSAGFMKNSIAVSNEGDELSLAEIATSTVANPVNRRHEMNTRMRGFEEFVKTLDAIKEGEAVAESAGFICDFYTLTTPSKYHRKKRINAQKVTDEMGKTHYEGGHFIDNPKYQPVLEIKNKDGLIERIPNTPKAAQNYLVKVFSRIRAKLKREGIETFGYRVVEPHHDGTPHWHLAFFMPEKDKARVRSIFRHYALQEDGDEQGALKHRFDAISHDPKKGSVTGYMTKYISKNIAGFGIGEDFESGLDCDDAVLRILAWKSLWGIRQFAFYGSPSVTVWRELRKLREPLSNPTIEKARLAADAGHWDLFITIMAKHDIKLHKTPALDDEGNERKNKYGETIMRVTGIKLENIDGVEVIKTRLKEWFLIDIEQLEERLIHGLPVAERDNAIYLDSIEKLIQQASDEKKLIRLHHATGGVIPASFDFFSNDGGHCTPWSSVNNCTEQIEGKKSENINQEIQ